MAQYSEDGYHEGFGESENYEGTENYERADNYGRSGGNYEGAETHEENTEQAEESTSYRVFPEGVNASPSRLDFINRRKQKFENEKINYEIWDKEKKWRPFMIMPRMWWKATAPSHTAPLDLPVEVVVMTYSHGRTCRNTYYCSREAKRTQLNHLQNGAVDVVYNFMIGGNGQVFEGRGWHSSPRLSHRLQRFSRNALHIAFLGNLKAVMPSDEMLQAAHDLIVFGVKNHFIAPKFLEYDTRLWILPEIPTESEVLNRLQEF